MIASGAMILTIGCAGFPVPATRYFKEFLFVEVQETHVTQPGTGTIRRWRREAPPGFSFAMLAPREIGQERAVATQASQHRPFGWPGRQPRLDAADPGEALQQAIGGTRIVGLGPVGRELECHARTGWP